MLVNRFRSQKVAPVRKDIFKQIVLLLADEGMVSLKKAYVDGTKIEANANRYTLVWGNANKANKGKMIKFYCQRPYRSPRYGARHSVH